MRQPTPTQKKKIPNPHQSRNEGKQQYGTSKLEKYFFDNYLAKYGFDIVYEYEAKDIGRFYDFAIVATLPDAELITEERHGITSLSQYRQYIRPLVIIEVDGDYFHGNPKTNGKHLTNMQKQNKCVDKIKDAWCEKHRIPLFRVWESDIRNNAPQVFALLEIVKKIVEESQTKPHRSSQPLKNR